VSLDEAATLAGILQTWRNAPTVNMERAKRRQSYVLQQMADKGFITQQEADDARARPIVLANSTSQPTSIAPYFLEEVRKELEGRYGAKALYESGLTVQTGLDMRLQEAANRALDAGLRRVDRIHGFRKPRRNVLDERHTLEGFKHPRWDRPIAAGDIVPAVVTNVDTGSIDVRAGRYRVAIDKKGFAWTRRANATQLVKRGDLVETRLSTKGSPPPPERWNSRRWSRGPCSRSTIAPVRSVRWSAATVSNAASSTARRRPSVKWDRRSSRSSTLPRSIAAIRRARSFRILR
jgi:penicillin-binding protein 1A